MAKKPQIIGGMFATGPVTGLSVKPPFWKGSVLALASARSGIRLVLECRQMKRIWLPSYLCGSIIDAAVAANAEILFYEVDGCLLPESGGWLKNVERGDLVLFIDYFGFPAPEDLMRDAKDRGAVILEDACQSLLSPPSEVSDYVLYSPRKYVGVSDGGILICRDGDPVASARLPRGSEDWMQNSLKAGERRAEFDRTGAENGWFGLFREAEVHCPTEPYMMSDRAREVLFGYDYGTISEKRRENYRTLLRALEGIALFPELPDAIVPMGFPVAVEDRDRVRNRLFENRIYPPVHWPLYEIVPREYSASHRLAAKIMTIPCDQRYDFEDMMRIISILTHP
ncbi:MAG: hypothetical protein AB7T27_10735 [Kiritimatiellia bacterium]